MSIIDLRSDTVTRPTAPMREAMARAEVGDDVYGEDPTVNRLQERVAELLGVEAALYVPSGTMANQIALRVNAQPGDDVVIGDGSHNWLYEAGAGGAHAGVQFTFVGTAGLFNGADLRAAWKPDNHHHAPTKLVTIENTHNRSGGRIWPEADVRGVLEAARALGVRTHLDGARLWNAAVASGKRERELAAGFDTVSVCLSKGLGAPVGSLICGTKDDMWRAHRVRKMYGGAMRQAGILAAAGLYALEHHRERLAEDHRNARLIAEKLGAARHIRPGTAETNILMLDLDGTAPDADTVSARARDEGVLANPVNARRIRVVTHLDVDARACERAAEVLARAAGG
jgi:threonine aldolase